MTVSPYLHSDLRDILLLTINSDFVLLQFHLITAYVTVILFTQILTRAGI